MPALYKDAKDWLRDSVESGAMDADTLLGFVLNEVSNDDVERWFGVNMDDDSDNPGAGMVYCSECHTDVDESDYDSNQDMCRDCAAELEEDEEEDTDGSWLSGLADHGYSDYEANIFCDMAIALGSITAGVWLRYTDFDYLWPEVEDRNVYEQYSASQEYTPCE